MRNLFSYFLRYLVSLRPKLEGGKSACKLPLDELQFPLDNLVFRDTWGLHGVKDLTLTLTGHRALRAVSPSSLRVWFVMPTDASKPSSWESGLWSPEPILAARLQMVGERSSLALLSPRSNCWPSCNCRELASLVLGCGCALEVCTSALRKVKFPLNSPR